MSAVLDAARKYRYELTRTIDNPALVETPRVLPITWVMLNPSTADEKENDPTIRKCMGFSRLWGFREMIVVNLFAYRATKPPVLKTVEDPIGPNNNDYILRACRRSGRVLCAWGLNGKLQNRGFNVTRLLIKDGHFPYCLRKTMEGHPMHPLYQRYDLAPIPFGGWKT